MRPLRGRDQQRDASGWTPSYQRQLRLAAQPGSGLWVYCPVPMLPPLTEVVLGQELNPFLSFRTSALRP